MMSGFRGEELDISGRGGKIVKDHLWTIHKDMLGQKSTYLLDFVLKKAKICNLSEMAMFEQPNVKLLVSSK